MKRSAKLTLLFLTLLGVQSAIAAPKIPSKLQGLWYIESSNKGDWDAFTIVDNHVEFFYDLYQLDSISTGKSDYQLWLSSKAKGKVTLRVALSSDSTGSFQFNQWDKPRTCKLVSKHPDVTYFSITEAQNKVKGDWIFADKISNAFSIKGKQILMDQQQWEMVWFGEYLNREYRALLKNKKNYSLVYVSNRGKSLRVAAEGAEKFYTLRASDPAIYQVLGNWYEPQANKWTYGFFEKFAIYNNEFWDYQGLEFSANKGKLTLKKGAKVINLVFDKKNDSLLSVKADDEIVREYKRAGKSLPAYQSKDESPFKDTHFQQIDTAYITGYLRNAPHLEPFTVSRTNVVKGEEENLYADVDSLGRFVIKVPLFNTQQVFIDWQRTNKIGVLEPGEHYFLHYDFTSGHYLIMGDNERLHNELAKYQPYTAFRESNDDQSRRAEIEKMKGMDYLEAKTAQLKKANSFFSEYLKLNPHLSAKTKYFVKNFNRYHTAFYLMQKRFDLDRAKQERFPEAYMAYVKDSLFTDPVKPFTLSRDFSSFTRDYIQYLKEAERSSGVSHTETLYKLVNNGSIPATNQEKQAVKLTWDIERLIGTDSVRSRKLTKMLTPALAKLEGDLKSRHQSTITDAAVETLWSNILASDYAFYQKYITDEDIRNSYYSQAVMGNLDMTRKPLETKHFEALLREIKSPVFRSSVMDYQNYLLKKTTIDFAYAASLKNTEHLKSSKDADSLLKELLAPYKGKVVYIDFWGTWCGPCREEMKYVGKAKEALKGKDVIFMYFANSSPEFTWKNMIKEMDLTGENVVHYKLPDLQQNMLERRLSVSSFPTYMLVNKAGEIATAKAPRPSNPIGLVAAVEELLK